MNDRIETLWAALGALTLAETVAVAEIMRDTWEAVIDFEPTDVQEWSFLLNAAREIAEQRAENEAA